MRKFWLDCVIATAFVFLAMWGLFGLTQLRIFDAFDTIGTALADVELTDYVFSGIRDDPSVDTTVTLINIGRLSRRDIAKQIDIISKYNPKVIGIDGFFDCETGIRDTVNCHQLKDPVGNQMLSDAIRRAGNVILVSKVLDVDSLREGLDSLRRSDGIYLDNAMGEGFANLETGAAYQDDVKTCRTFPPVLSVNGRDEVAFAVKMASVYDSVKTKNFLARDNYSEIINYRGNVADYFHQTNYPQMFFTLDVGDVMTENFVEEVIKDKVVILGFLGEELGDPSWADKFYTPLNKKLAGKSNPDMFGAVVHANIVSMILNEDYVDQMAEWEAGVMAIIICLLNVALFSLINTNFPLWYDGVTKLLQLIQILLYSVLMVVILAYSAYKIDVALTLAAVALVGDVYEIYMSVLKNLFFKIKSRFSFTRKADDVLIPESSEKP